MAMVAATWKERKSPAILIVVRDIRVWFRGKMRGIVDRRCLNYGPAAQEIPSGSAINFEYHKGNGPKNRASHSRTALGKPTPSKWDDAQKWLVNLSRGGGERNQSKNNPRNSNADDRRLIAPPVLFSGEDHEGDGEEKYGSFPGSANSAQFLAEETTKKVVQDSEEESIWRINKPSHLTSESAVRSICVRDMGTEMTPIASQEPSRTGTPIRAARSPISSGSTTPVRTQNRVPLPQSCRDYLPEAGSSRGSEKKDLEQAKKLDPLEARAMAWDEAERAKHMARFKREEVKIQAWENHEKRKAEMDMRRMEVKAERLKARAQERLANRLAAASRIAEEKRANAESKLHEKAIKTSERADYMKRTGHLPSSFSFKLPSFCW